MLSGGNLICGVFINGNITHILRGEKKNYEGDRTIKKQPKTKGRNFVFDSYRISKFKRVVVASENG